MFSKFLGVVAGTLVASLYALEVARGADVVPTNPHSGNAEIATEGQSLFNQYCSHCHGFDAIQAERVRDLRRMTRRYQADAINVYLKTVNEGRMDKGMPVWKGVLSDDVLWRIYTFLEAAQTK